MLLFIDNIFRFVQAGSEVSALMGRMPSAVGYQPTLANELGALQAVSYTHLVQLARAKVLAHKGRGRHRHGVALAHAAHIEGHILALIHSGRRALP